MTDRLYDEEEISRILQRAAELQGQRLHPDSTGLSLEELKRLASESGLDPALVVTAAAELHNRQAGDQRNFWGGPFSHTVDLVLPGPVSDHGWERMLDAVRGLMGQIGRVEVRDTTREWVVDRKEEGNGRFSVRQEPDGSSHVHIHWNSPLPAVLVYIATGILSLIALPFIFSELALGVFPGIPAWIALVGALYFIARWSASRFASKERGRVQNLMRSVSAIGASEAVGSGEPESERSTGILDLDFDDSEEKETGFPGRLRERS